MSRLSSHAVYVLLEQIRRRVLVHKWTTEATREEQAELEAELYAEEERLTGGWQEMLEEVAT